MTENLRRIEQHRRVSSSAALSGQDVTVEGEVPLGGEEEVPTTIAHQKDISAEQNIETARALFEEQLEFLDKEKAKLLQELPPLAPVASSEDLSSDDADAIGGASKEEKKNITGRQPLSTQLSQEEYALDLACPPILARLPHLCKSRPQKCHGMRPASASFLAEWRRKIYKQE